MPTGGRRIQFPCTRIGNERTGDQREILCKLPDDPGSNVVAAATVQTAPDFNATTYIGSSLMNTTLDPTMFVVDGQFSMSFWFRITSSSTNRLDILHVAFTPQGGSAEPKFVVMRSDLASGNKLRIMGWNGALDELVVDFESLDAYTDVLNPGWHHVVASADLSAPTVTLWIDGEQALESINVLEFGETIAFDYWEGVMDVSKWEIGGGQNVMGDQYEGCLAEFWVQPGVYLNFNQEDERSKFLTGGTAQVPANLGAGGSLPLKGKDDTTPYVYLRRAFTTFEINDGDRQNFAVNSGGALVACSLQPAL